MPKLAAEPLAPRRARAPRARRRAGELSPRRALGRLGRVRSAGLAAQGPAPLRADPHDLLQLRGRLRAARLRRQATRCRSRSSRATPTHPGSRGRNCAKGPATLNQVYDPERIRHPLRRVGPRGRRDSGSASRGTRPSTTSRAASGRPSWRGGQKEVMYHLGRPGHELIYLQRVFHAWGIDGHNSHTNVCSASARAGYAFWHGMDRPVARSCQRALHPAPVRHTWRPGTTSTRTPSGSSRPRCAGPGSACSTRGSATPRPWPTGGSRPGPARRPPSSWPWPTSSSRSASTTGSSSAAGRTGTSICASERPDLPVTFEAFEQASWTSSTPSTRRSSPRRRAGSRRPRSWRSRGPSGARARALATHIWRNTAAGNLGGWQVARALELLVVLMGAVEHRGRHGAQRVEQGRPGAADDAAARQGVERAPDAEGVPAGLLRDELPAPALPARGPRQARHVLHAGLQPRVDEPRWPLVDGDADRRGQGRAPRVSHAGVERDGLVRRLRAAHGRTPPSATI